jgi:hypothetical protein
MQDDPYHYLNCVRSLSGHTIARHNLIRDIIQRAATKAGMSAQSEPYYLSSDDDTRVDLLLMYISAMSLIDVAVINTHYLSDRDPTTSVASRETQKHTKHFKTANEHAAIFIPFVVSTYGALGDKARTLIRNIQTAAYNTLFRGDVPAFLNEFKSSIAVAVQVGNSLMMSVGYSRQTRLSISRILAPETQQAAIRPSRRPSNPSPLVRRRSSRLLGLHGN